MENFVDRIIETDRKARAIIEAAQAEKETYLQQVQTQAQTMLAQRDAENDAQMHAMDDEFAAREKAQSVVVYEQYIEAKRKLDDAFETKRTTWLDATMKTVLEV